MIGISRNYGIVKQYTIGLVTSEVVTPLREEFEEMSSQHLKNMLLSLQQFQDSKISITINDHNNDALFTVSLSESLFQITNINNHKTETSDNVDSVVEYIENNIFTN